MTEVKDRSPTVVIADDSADDRAIARLALMRGATQHFRFHEVELAADAIAACSRQPAPACVLLDLNLPDMDAFEVLQCVRLAPGIARVPVVIVTGSDDVHAGREAVRAGAMGFIGKDWLTPASLARTVERAIERHRMMLEQQELLERLRESEDHYRHTVELNPQVPWTAGPDGGLMDFNGRWLELTGMSREEALGEGRTSVIHPEDLPRVSEAWMRSIAEGAPFEVEHRIRCADATFRWMRSTARARRDVDGTVVRWYGLTEDIHDRKAAQDAVVERDARLRLALEASGAGTFHHDLRTDRVKWSEELERMVGYEPGGFGGTFGEFLRHVHSGDLGTMRSLIERAVRRCENYQFEFRMVRVDGSVFWLAGRGSAFAQDGAVADTITGVGFDITGRKRAEERLREREQQLSLAQRAAGLGLWDWDVVNDTAQWSEEAWAMFAPDARGGEVTYLRWITSIHPEDRDRAARAVELALAGSGYRDEFRVKDAEGGTRWLEATGEFIRNAAGEPIRMIGVVRDITERKSAESALRDSEARFRRMSETMPQIVYTCRPDGGCDWVNRYWYDYTGETEFSQFRWAECLHPEDRERVLPFWGERVASGEPFTTEYRYRRENGTYGWHLSRAVPIRGEGGEILQWVGSSTDVSALREGQEIREQLMLSERAARGQLEEASHLKDEFLAVLAHELRNPLANIVSWSEVVRARVDDPDVVRRGVGIIRSNAATQAKLISDLMDVNRISRGKVTLDIRPVAVGDFIERCVASQRPAAEAKGVALEARKAKEPQARLLVDEARMQQVMGNLISNAIKFTPPGGQVIVSSEVTPEGVEIAVADTGEGIAPAALAWIFEPFRQAEQGTTRRHGGLGLGLAVVRQLVGLHGGSVTAESAGPGAGSRFTLRLPLDPAAAPIATSPDDDATPALGPDALRGIEVLLVDDDASMVEFACRMLEEHGARVRTAGNGEHALEILRSFDRQAQQRIVLVSDLGMPVMDGFTLIRHVRDLLGLLSDRVPALAVSAFSRPEDRQAALAAGYQAYLIKPFEAAKLIGHVARLFGRGVTGARQPASRERES